MAEWIIALAALGALVVSVWNARKIQELHISVDGRLTQLLASKDALLSTKVEAAHAEGRLAGIVEGATELPKKT